MTFQNRCPHCDAVLNLEDRHDGHTVHCPRCQSRFAASRPIAVQPELSPQQAKPNADVAVDAYMRATGGGHELGPRRYGLPSALVPLLWMGAVLCTLAAAVMVFVAGVLAGLLTLSLALACGVAASLLGLVLDVASDVSTICSIQQEKARRAKPR